MKTVSRLVLLSTSILFAFLCAGVVFGYQSFKDMAIDAGVYSYLCNSNNNNDDQVDAENGENLVCTEQKSRLDLIYTVAACVTNIMAIVIGLTLDRFGPRVTAAIGSLIFALGTVFMALSHPVAIGGEEGTESRLDLYFPGYSLLAVGGPFIFVSTLHVSKVFPRHSGLCMSLITGSFDASAIVFWLFDLVYRSQLMQSVSSGIKKIQWIFGIYSVVPALALLWSLVIMPKRVLDSTQQISDEEEEQIDVPSNGEQDLDTQPLLKDDDDNVKVEQRSANKIDDELGLGLYAKSAISQLKSTTFLWLVAFMCIYMVRLNMYISSAKEQLGRYIDSEDQLQQLHWWFGLLLPLGGVIAIPVSTYTLDHLQLHYSFLTITALNLLSAALSFTRHPAGQIINIIAFVTMRPLVYTVSNEFVGRAFGFKHFGIVYGLMTMISGVFNFSTYALNLIVINVTNGDYLLVNIGLYSASLLVSMGFSLYIQKCYAAKYSRESIVSRDNDIYYTLIQDTE
ncbi:hypothetical protein MP228_000805 [Amoeboaphelidium protococcarum]|nr:hypothetical protein MP228_000805 [Amoeboaphelidium protococcarum]